MKTHHLVQMQFLPVTIGEAWEFFSSPRNLDEITPPRLRFSILDITPDGPMCAGQLIRYKIRLLPLVRINWLTEITAVKANEYFIDEQRLGPYAFWQHRHSFKEAGGGIEMTDEVAYALPFGWLGELVHRFFVRKALNNIFAYRKVALAEVFNRNTENKTLAA